MKMLFAPVAVATSLAAMATVEATPLKAAAVVVASLAATATVEAGSIVYPDAIECPTTNSFEIAHIWCTGTLYTLDLQCGPPASNNSNVIEDAQVLLHEVGTTHPLPGATMDIPINLTKRLPDTGTAWAVAWAVVRSNGTFLEIIDSVIDCL